MPLQNPLSLILHLLPRSFASLWRISIILSSFHMDNTINTYTYSQVTRSLPLFLIFQIPITKLIIKIQLISQNKWKIIYLNILYITENNNSVTKHTCAQKTYSIRYYSVVSHVQHRLSFYIIFLFHLSLTATLFFLYLVSSQLYFLLNSLTGCYIISEQNSYMYTQIERQVSTSLFRPIKTVFGKVPAFIYLYINFFFQLSLWQSSTIIFHLPKQINFIIILSYLIFQILKIIFNI